MLRRAWVLVSIVVSAVSMGQVQLSPPPDKEAERRQFHLPEVRPMSGSERLRAYQQRVQLESQSFFSQLRWRNLGPEIQGGRVIAFTAPKDRPRDLYVAFATGGLWRSVDEGNSWTPLFDRESAVALGDVQVSADGQTLWVGTGENNAQRTGYSGTGVFVSRDRGQTWKHAGLEETHRIGKIQLHPKNANVVYVGAAGPQYSQSPHRGVYKTTDGGQTWAHVLKINDSTGVIDLRMDPRNPEVLYAATWDRDRRAWNLREGGPGTGIYKTTNGGKSWTKLTRGLPASGNLGRIGLAIAPSRPDTLYAFIDDQSADPDTLYRDEFVRSGVLTARRFSRLTKDQFLALEKPVLERFWSTYLPRESKLDETLQALQDGKATLQSVADQMKRRNPEVFTQELVLSVLYRSDDAGQTWRKTHPGTLGEHGGYYWHKVSVNPRNPDDVLTLGVILLRSQDGGKSWNSKAQSVHVDHHVYWFDPTRPEFQVSGNDGGIYFSYDNGETWRHVNNLPVAQATTIAVDNKTPYNVYIGNQDNGSMKGPSTYVPGRSRPFQWTSWGGGDGSAIAVDPRDDGDLIYGASQFGAHFAYNQKTLERYSLRAAPGMNSPDLRWNWISPIQISTHHPDIVYLGSNKLHRSLNRGRTFETISPDLTKNRPNGDVPFSTLKEISESPLKFGQILVGADDGTVQITRDHGNSWTKIPTPSPDKWVSRVISSRHDLNTLYVAQNGYRDDDWKPYLWRSTDLGKTWTSIAGNLPFEPINVVREDPTKPDWLYVGTDLGVWVSFDRGQAWTPLHGGIPRTPVHDLVIQDREKELVIASHARGVFVFRLDDLYRLVDAPETKKPLHLYSVANQTHGNWSYRRRPEWSSTDPEPTINGELWTQAAREGVVRLKQGDQTLVEIRVTFARGFNRYQIPLLKQRSQKGTVDPKAEKDPLKDPYAAERAVYFEPGDYTIEVEIGPERQSIPVKLT